MHCFEQPRQVLAGRDRPDGEYKVAWQIVTAANVRRQRVVRVEWMENRVHAVRDYGDELGPDLKPLDDLRLGGVRASDHRARTPGEPGHDHGGCGLLHLPAGLGPIAGSFPAVVTVHDVMPP